MCADAGPETLAGKKGAPLIVSPASCRPTRAPATSPPGLASSTPVWALDCDGLSAQFLGSNLSLLQMPQRSIHQREITLFPRSLSATYSESRAHGQPGMWPSCTSCKLFKNNSTDNRVNICILCLLLGPFNGQHWKGCPSCLAVSQPLQHRCVYLTATQTASPSRPAGTGLMRGRHVPKQFKWES